MDIGYENKSLLGCLEVKMYKAQLIRCQHVQ